MSPRLRSTALVALLAPAAALAQQPTATPVSSAPPPAAAPAASAAPAAPASVEQQLAAAVLPLPAGMRAGATVLGYAPGAAAPRLDVLRRGTNGMICLADDPRQPRYHVACYHESMEPFMARGRALRREGVQGDQVDTVRFREVASGKLPLPRQGGMLYQLTGTGFDAATGSITEARGLYVMYLPYATEATTGLSATPSRGTPWLMFPGTPKAHIMFTPDMR
jgi:hypothetical protein